MRVDAASRRYAKAVNDLAAEEGNAEAVGAALTKFAELERDSEPFHNLLVNPVFKGASRDKVVAEVLERIGAPDTMRKLLGLLSDRNRGALIGSIAGAYQQLEDERAGRQRVHITAAAALSDTEVAALEAALKKLSGAQELVLEMDVDADLIAGVVARVGDRLYDGSLRSSLRSIRERLVGQSA